MSGAALCVFAVLIGAAWLGAPAAAAAVSDRFSIVEYRVLGNSVLAGRDLEELLYPLLGEDKSIGDVEAARLALETLYKDRGYGTLYVDIPEQQVRDGVVRLRVTEGKLGKVRVSGARYYSSRRILAAVPELQPGKVLHLPSLQAELNQLNQKSGDRQVTPVLRAGGQAGEVDTELKVADSLPLHLTVEANDRYTANTTRSRLSITASYDNLFQRQHSLSLQYQISPQQREQVQVLAATYVAPLPRSNNLLALYGVDSNSDFAVAGSGVALGIVGAGRIYGARYIVRPASISSGTHSFSFGVDHKDFRDSIRLDAASTDSTPIKYLAWSLGYGGAWRAGASENLRSRSTNVNFGLGFGVRGWANDPREFEYKRYNARANFLHLRADWQHGRPLWGASTLYLKVAGQLSPDPLIGNEQYSIGGADSVRGYLESEQLGDLGLAGTLEWRTPSLHRRLGPRGERLVGLVFADAGTVRILDPLPDATNSYVRYHTLASAGFGLRVAVAGFSSSLDWARNFRAGARTPLGAERVHLQFRYGL